MIKELATKENFREIFLYGVFGAMSTLLDIGLFWLFANVFDFHYLIANALAWISAIIFSFLVNKFYVFESKSFKKEVWIKEAAEFFGARGIACGIDMGGMYILVSIMQVDKNVSKIIVSLVVILINYVLSKFWIFKKV